MKNVLFILVLILVAYAGFHEYQPRSTESAAVAPTAANSELERAFKNQTSNVQVQGEGVVSKVLPDDNNGSRHQRFLLRVSPKLTILIAHNIDLAPRIPSLVTGETISFQGEYEWTSKGGVIHWTHHDPSARHAPGWLSRNGKKYQ